MLESLADIDTPAAAALSTTARPRWRSKSTVQKTGLLGIPFGTANARLRKAILFSLVQRLAIDTCHRCDQKILTCEELSIEHKESWQLAANPVAAFFDLDNIGFSHLSCNISAASRPNKRFATATDRNRARDKRKQPRRTARKKAWRARRRLAGLPYT
jgi:hypothetical protein